MMYLLFVLGLAFLVGGGELLINSGVKLAKKLHLPPLVIGVVLMGCGTSLPELSASITALSNGVPGMAFGKHIKYFICFRLICVVVACAHRLDRISS